MKPILFSTAMVNAILENRKTQTRRIVDKTDDNWLCKYDTVFAGKTNNSRGKTTFHFKQKDSLTIAAGYSPRYEVGDILYVRETWQHTQNLGLRPDDENYGYVYRADGLDWEPMVEEWRWKSPRFMPKNAARIFLKVTGVRVERLLAITEEDAMAEGIVGISKDGVVKKYCVLDQGDHSSVPWAKMPYYATACYFQLWDKIHGPGSADLNPWVWVYEFERVESKGGRGSNLRPLSWRAAKIPQNC